ncbi:MAG: AbrB family transcriptional regulator [Pseudomonadota bacterium]
MKGRAVGLFALTLIAVVGGWLASHTPLPMPWMLGSLFATALSAPLLARSFATCPTYPEQVRRVCIAIIGVMIGASFTPALLSILPSLWLSLLAMLAFVLLSHGVGYTLFRRVGGYDAKTAFYASMPGGLIEAIAFGEAAGCDSRTLTVQHFTRIVLVVLVVPLSLLLWHGSAVGSAAGEALSRGAWDASDVVWVASLAAAGLVLSPWLRLPAGHLMTPLLVSALLHAVGWAAVASPDGLLHVAQLIVGAGLGTRFVDFDRRQLLRALGMSSLSISCVLVLSVGFAVALSEVTPLPVEALFISFAPGGVTEMSLIALSFGVSPMLVALHHLLRITITVGSVVIWARVLWGRTR